MMAHSKSFLLVHHQVSIQFVFIKRKQEFFAARLCAMLKNDEFYLCYQKWLRIPWPQAAVVVVEWCIWTFFAIHDTQNHFLNLQQWLGLIYSQANESYLLVANEKVFDGFLFCLA